MLKSVSSLAGNLIDELPGTFSPGEKATLMLLPTELLFCEINKYLIELDRQILRRVCIKLFEMFQYKLIEFNDKDLKVELVHVKRYIKFRSKQTMYNAACRGQLEIIKYLYIYRDKLAWDVEVSKNVVESGNLEALKYIRSVPEPCSWDVGSTSAAAKAGFLHILKYLYENGCQINEWVIAFAAFKGHLNILKYLRSLPEPCPWDHNTTAWAAEGGHLECLKYAHENGCDWDFLTPALAAFGGHLECLKYAYENGCRWNEITTSYAAQTGHLQSLKYARENGCPWDSRTPYYAAVHNKIECLKYAFENGCPWDPSTRDNTLKFAHLHNCYTDIIAL